MHITDEGVSLEYSDGSVLRTELRPNKLFPNQTKLSKKDISNIHRFIKFKKYKLGQLYNNREMFKFLREFNIQTRSSKR